MALLRILSISIIMLLLGSQFSWAQKLEYSNRDWRVFSTVQQGKRVCYMLNLPDVRAGTVKKRGDVFVLVTQVKPGVDEFSVSSGYEFKKDAVKLSMGKKSFELFTKGSLAWAPSQKQDSEIVKSMKKENKLVVEATAQNNQKSKDSYSLRGFTASYQWMTDHCK